MKWLWWKGFVIVEVVAARQDLARWKRREGEGMRVIPVAVSDTNRGVSSNTVLFSFFF